MLKRGLLNSLHHRLYVRIYLALLASLVAAGAMFAMVHIVHDRQQARTSFDTFAEIAGEVLPPAAASAAEQKEALGRWRARLRTAMTLYAPDGTLIASAGRPLPLPPQQAKDGRVKGTIGTFILKLPDGRYLVCRRMHNSRAPVNVLMLLAMVAVVVALGAFPVVRRLTRRLERLQGSVDTWGGGALSTRVPIEGRDEVASLATSFNEAADRIEALVTAQKSLLANASHELRSPLARIRMAVELLEDQASPAIREELKQNIGELDQLIDEVLLASRLDAAQQAEVRDEVDLAGIVAEECGRVGARFEADKVSVRGDARLLRRLLRNLLENARRYGADTDVRVSLRGSGDGVLLTVCDQGPGVPDDLRERIFEPFYRLPGATEAAGGVGLGLSLVRQIARHHGGDVRCTANTPHGACFAVTLPSAQSRDS